MKTLHGDVQYVQTLLLAYIVTISASFLFSSDEHIQKLFGITDDSQTVLLFVLIWLIFGFVLTISTLKPRDENQQEKEKRFRGALLPLEIFFSTLLGFSSVGLVVVISALEKTTSSTNWFSIFSDKTTPFFLELIKDNPVLSSVLFTLLFGSLLFDWQSHHWEKLGFKVFYILEKLIQKIKKFFTKN